MATKADVQAKIDAAISKLKETTQTGAKMVGAYGADDTKWPTTSKWFVGLDNLHKARSEVGLLIDPAPDPIPTPTPVGELAFPIRCTFYYGWYPNTWTVGGAHVKYHPTLGYYDSVSQAAVDQHIKMMDYAKIKLAIFSWHTAADSHEQAALALLLSRIKALGSDLRVCIYYEMEGFGDPTVARIQTDLAYVEQTYVPDPHYLKIGGKPVAFIYNADDDTSGQEMLNRWAQAAGTKWYRSHKVFSGYKTCSNQPDTWHQYGPDVREDRQSGYSFSISPGWWRPDQSTPKLTRDPATWTKNVQDMVASKEKWQIVLTFNEWGEGTAVENATEWDSPSGMGVYLDALHNN